MIYHNEFNLIVSGVSVIASAYIFGICMLDLTVGHS